MIKIDRQSSIFYIFELFKNNSFIVKLYFRFFIGRYWFLKRAYYEEDEVYIDLKTASRKEVDFFLQELYNIYYYANINNVVNSSLRDTNKVSRYIFYSIFILDEKEYLVTKTMKELVA